MTTWLTSDPHFWHANVIKYCNRPYANVEEMNEALVRNWNSVVMPDDTVYCMGDFSFAVRPIELYSYRLQGKKKLVPGNHDPIHPYNKIYKKARNKGDGELQKLFQVYEDHGWEILPLSSTLDIPGVATVNLNHMPYDTSDQRYQEFKADDDGRWLLCGHIHEHWKIRERMINVGVDVWNYTPVSIDTISEIILGTYTEKGRDASVPTQG